MKIRKEKEPVFKRSPLKKRSFWGWLFNRNVAGNAIIELFNAIVDAGRPSAVAKKQIETIHSKYPFDIYKHFAFHIDSAYTAFVRRVFSGLANTELTQGDVDDIAALQTIFRIPDDSVVQLNLKAGAMVYRDALNAALADSVLTDEEKRGLLHLGKQLDLDENTMHSLYNQALSDLIQKKVEGALKDGELSPDEEADIAATCKRFDIDLSYGSNMEHAIRRAKNLWVLKHAPLSPMNVDIQLKRDENCYAKFDVLWLEVRRNPAMPWHPRYRTLTDKSEIALSYAPIVEDCLSEIDDGMLFVTDKRLIFVGKSASKTITFSEILKIELFREGIKVHKARGRSPYFVSDRAAPLGAVAERLFKESQQKMLAGVVN